MKNFEITTQTGRIDKVLSALTNDISRSQIKQLIIKGNVKVNGEKIKPRYTVKRGDQISLIIPHHQKLELVPENIPLDIIYEDQDVIVVNKPQGMVVHPAPGHQDHTLVNALLYHCPLSTINGTFRPGIVHRIDKDTSGLLMIAKNDMAHQSLAAQLKNKTNKREYIALVYGQIKEDKGTINAPLGRDPKDRKRQAVVLNGRKAITHYEVLKRYPNFTLIKCILETGRTHQIRVHMKYIRHPLVGDPLYGPRKIIGDQGQFLHAAVLGFKHPRTGKEMLFDAPLPSNFQKMLQQLDRQK